MNTFLPNTANNLILYSDKKVDSISPQKEIHNNHKIKQKIDSIY